MVMVWVASDFDDWPKLSKVSAASRREKHTKTTHTPLDTPIMEFADDIACGGQDLEDAIGPGLIRHQTVSQCHEEADDDTHKTRTEMVQRFVDPHHGGQLDDVAKNPSNLATHSRTAPIADEGCNRSPPVTTSKRISED